MARTIEIRRHAYTKKGEQRGKGSHLSAQGVAQARRIGEQIGPFDRVLASQIPRTLETSLAMGFAVDDLLAVLGEIPLAVWEEIGHQERWAWDDPFVQFARCIAGGGPTAELG